MVYPNLVIAGAPKCGTSSLFRWLADHPQACGSRVKETFYLMDAGHPLARPGDNYHERGLDAYARFFEHCDVDSARIIFEATTHYIYQRTALEVLSKLNTTPHVVFVLRKPSERVYSSYQYTRNNLSNLSREVSFKEFVGLVKGETNGALLRERAGASAYVLKNDIKYSQYVEYVAPWAARLGRARTHVLLFEEMREDPRRFMRGFSERIGLDPGFYDGYDFPRKNETVNIQHQRVHRRARSLGGMLPRGFVKEFVKGVYFKAQSGGNARSVKSDEDRAALAELEQEFRPFNQRLAEEFGLDLSAWN